MALNRRQRLAYKHLCNIYRSQPVTDPVTGERGDDVYQLVAAAVPCLYQYTTNIGEPGRIARLERVTLLTTDSIRCAVDVDVQEGDYLRDVTPGNPNARTVHRAQGAPMRIPNAGRRRANESIVLIMPEQKPPAEVLA